MTEQPKHELIDVHETAHYLRTTAVALYSQRHRGEAPGALGVLVGKRLLWRRSVLDAWYDNQLQEARQR